MIRIAGWTMCAIFAVAVSADDWPRWGGPERNHISNEKGLMQEWPSGGPKQVWVSDKIGMGYAGASIAQGKVFTMGTRDGKEVLLALEEKSGKEIWSAAIGAILKNEWGDGPRGTPTVSGDKVYALGGQETLIAAQLSDGKVLWQKTMSELGGKIPYWGYTESVLVEGENAYCTPGGEKGAIAALDAKTGEIRWQSKDFTEGAQYASIVPARINNTPQLVQLTMLKLVSLNPKDGSVVWQSDWPGKTAVIPTPIVWSNYVYITAGYGVGCKLVKIGPDNQPTDVYENKVMKNHHGGVVLIDGHVYGHSEPVGWVCQKFMTGEEVWADKSLGKGAVTYAGGRLYCLEESSGTVVLAEASPKGWKEHGRFKLEPQAAQRPSRGKVWMHPVIANGKLYLRDQEVLACYDVAAK